MHPLQTIAVRAARAAGDFIVRHLDRLDRISVAEKGRNDLVSEVDKGAEDHIIGIIRRAYPSHGILAEESGHSPGDEFEWVIDPLDGTMNFLQGIPHFAVSIAVRHRGKLDQAVVFDPVRQEIFSASQGSGAQLDGRRIRVGTTRRELRGAVLGYGFPFREMANLESHLAELRNLSPKCGGLRCSGSAALDLAYVAAGRLDGFWEWGLQPWDIAAGALLVREAGGIVTDEQDAQGFLDSGNVVAASPRVHAALVQTLARTRRRQA